jgi:hypothetical protein
MRRPKAPEGLAEGGRALWRAITGEYELSPGELETLRQACRVTDLLARLDAVLMTEDPVQESAAGTPKAHPLLAASADQRRLLAGLFRDMALPMPDEAEGHRRAPAAVAAAQARWRAQRG